MAPRSLSNTSVKSIDAKHADQCGLEDAVFNVPRITHALGRANRALLCSTLLIRGMFFRAGRIYSFLGSSTKCNTF